jgi:ATP-dependent DNA helicase RecG
MGLAALDATLLARAIEAGGGVDAMPADYLVRRRLAERIDAKVVLREAAVLLFAERPETIAHPNAGVRVMRVAGTERLTGARYNVREFPRIEGNLPSVLAQVRTLLDTLIDRSARLRDLFFEETPEYPTFAWQEAIVNAVAHRDYSIQGQSVESGFTTIASRSGVPGLLRPRFHSTICAWAAPRTPVATRASRACSPSSA